MGVEKDAKIQLGIEGLDDLVRAAKRSEDAWTRAGGKIAGAIQGLGKEAESTFKGMVDNVLKAATAAAAFDLAHEIQGVRKFREETSRMAIASGQDVKVLGEQFKVIGQRILQTPDAVAAFAKSLGRSTYDIRGATKATTGLGLEALNTGKSLEEMSGLGKVLHDSLGVTGDTEEAMKRLRGQVDALGTRGGVAALHDTISSLGPVLDQVAGKAGGARDKITAFLAGVKGPSVDYNKRVAGSILGDITRDPRAYERAAGIKRGSLTDEFGHVKDPVAAAEIAKKAIMKLAGGDKALAAQMAGNRFGVEAGAALMNGVIDFDAIKKAEKATKAIPRSFLQTDAGRQLGAKLENDAAKRAIAEKAVPVVDWAERHPMLAAAGGLLGGSALKWAGGKAITAGTGALASGVAKAGIAGTLGTGAAAVVGGLGLGYGLGTALDRYTGLSGNIAAAGLRPELEALESDPKAAEERKLSTARTIMRNVDAGVITKDEGDKRLADLDSRAREQIAAIQGIAKATGSEIGQALHRQPLRVMIVEPALSGEVSQ